MGPILTLSRPGDENRCAGVHSEGRSADAGAGSLGQMKRQGRKIQWTILVYLNAAIAPCVPSLLTTLQR